MARRGQSGSLAARPALSRPTPSASFLESGCHRLQGKGTGEGALRGILPPPTWVISDPSHDVTSRG